MVDNFTENDFKILRKIYFLKIKEEIIVKNLAELIGINRNGSSFIVFFKKLKDNDLIKIRKTIGRNYLITINKKNIEELIFEKSEEYKNWKKFVEETHQIVI
jgi:hypothetical protein